MEQSVVTTWSDDIELAKSAMAASAFSAIEAGRLLKQAKDKHRVTIGSKGWTQAIEERGISQAAADSFINVYERLGSERYINVSFDSPTVMRRLAAPSTPQEAVDEVVERVASGEKVTVKVAEEIIAQAKAEARAEQLAADREELRLALAQSSTRVENMEAVVTKATTDRRAAEKQVADLENRMATGPSQRLQQELEDAQDKLHKKQQHVDSLEVSLIGERNTIRELRLARHTSDGARTVRQLFSSAATKATAALAEVASYDIDPEYFVGATWTTLDTLKKQMEATCEAIDFIFINRGPVVDAD